MTPALVLASPLVRLAVHSIFITFPAPDTFRPEEE
jgi:hypothetical protein